MTKGYNAIKAEFTNKLVNEVEDFEESFSGTIYIKDNKYRLDFMNTTTFCDGTTKWIYLEDSEEVNIVDNESNVEEEDNLLSDPSKALTIYENGFKYLYVEETELDGIKVSVIDLVPESLDKSYSRIRLFVNKAKSQIYSLKYFSKDGNNYIFTINKLETNLKLQESFFKFNQDEYPDVEVIDMRE